MRSAVVTALGLAWLATLLTQWASTPGVVSITPLLIAAHVVAGFGLVTWSATAMHNAGLVTAPSRYRKSASSSVVVVLWLLALVAVIATVLIFRELEGQLGQSDDGQAVGFMVVTVLAGFVVVWLPFRYHARQASRIGAPVRVMIAWFFVPLVVAIGALLALAADTRPTLATAGMSRSEWAIEVLLVYGLPSLVFILSTWRAVTVFDEVIELRWERWRVEWNRTLDELADLPEPGPEDSPSSPPA